MCLSVEQIDQLQPAPAQLIHGAALFYEQIGEPGVVNDKWGVVLYPLDGTTGQGQVLATDTSWGTLSVDGSKAAYPATDGIHVVDLATKAETFLAAAGGFDLHLSPDGSQVAFVSSNADGVSVIDTGGSSPARQISDQSYESVIGWSPDSRQVYIAIPYTGGSAWKIQAVDVASQAAQDLFTIENGSHKSLSAAISPDGTWIAYRGQENDSLILVRTDGSQMHPVIELSGGITGIAWSKSGWIGLSLYNPDNYERRIVLLQPDSCQAYVLPGLHGDLEGLFLP
jgi:Tol biopolymer transport system component